MRRQGTSKDGRARLKALVKTSKQASVLVVGSVVTIEVRLKRLFTRGRNHRPRVFVPELQCGSTRETRGGCA